ncbi:hypothetical protein PFICI_12525 [Pestalotiopsis fici W106-1]|uniref:Uncharacterized protein n=1 Tax=Pestalotiopsis fici (strain W106-1 / CGMCC3.15140) TaxID=1229662 RepID=W3WRY0_PESFW|nr:uncharacterized protein PFICI_12525 [Pestalotiopsis fici W106-1]ETS75581.1 hypothetical protein PFICI_12525 [Pestalotiopsis fici W106-1]
MRFRAGLPIVRQLLDAGACLQGHEIVEAVRNDDQELAKFLLTLAVDVIARDPIGETLLDAAYRKKDFDLAQYYFDHGGQHSSKALLFAVNRALSARDYHGIEEFVTRRLTGPLDEWEAAGFVLSIYMNNSRLTDLFLSETFSASSALSLYCWHREPRKEGRLCRTGNEREYGPGVKLESIQSECHSVRCPNCCSPFTMAALLGLRDLLERMINQKYQPDASYLLKIIYKPGALDKKIQEILMKSFFDSTGTDQYVHRHMLMAAIANSTGRETIRRHVSNSGSLNFSIDGYRNESVGDLLAAGATVDWTSSRMQWTALRTALRSDSLQIAALLLENGVVVDGLSHSSIWTAREGHLKTVEFLLNHGLAIDALWDNTARFAPYSKYLNALEAAAGHGRIDTVAFLLARGAKIQGRGRVHFVRAVNFAIESCHQATADLLKDKGGWSQED